MSQRRSSSPLLRGSGQLLGFTDVGAPATASNLTIHPGIVMGGATSTFNIIIDGGAEVAFLVDNSGSGMDMSANDVCTALAAGWPTAGALGTYTPDGLGGLAIVSPTTGVTSSINFINSGTLVHGSDAVPPSGNVSEVELIPVMVGKVVKPVAVGYEGSGLAITWDVSLKTAGPTYTPVALVPAGDGTGRLLFPASTTIAAWLAGAINASLVARMTDTTPNGGDVTAWALCEQV